MVFPVTITPSHASGFILGLSTLATDNAPANYIVGIIVFMIALGFAALAAIDAILLIKVV